MTLKCIGGPNDGEYRETYDKRYGDLIIIHQYDPMIATSFDANQIPEILEIKTACYKVERICWRKDGKSKEWSFLLYEKLTIFDVFNKLFT